MSKGAFKINWKYALGEILLIFIGVSLAVAFQAWNDSRKRDKLEKDILLQIYNDILVNQLDVQADYARLSFGLEAHFNMLDYLNGDHDYVDSMCFDFYWLQHDEYVFPLRGGYDNLKEHGLDLIKDDSIRGYVQGAYESAYPRVSKETAFYPDINEYFSAFYQEHFVPNTDTSLVHIKDTQLGRIKYPYNSDLGNLQHKVHIGYVPLNFEELKRNTQFKTMLRQSQEYRRYKMIQYENANGISDWLIEHLEDELKIEKDPQSGQ